MFTWLIPLLYVQMQSFVLDIPRLFNDFLNFVSTIPTAFPELVNSDQISVFFQAAFSVTIPIVIIGLLQFGLGPQFYLLIGLYLLLQFIDGNLLVPIIFSEAVKLHPIIIILAVFIFGSMFGFWGVFFSIPLATFIKAVWNAWPKMASSNEE